MKSLFLVIIVLIFSTQTHAQPGRSTAHNRVHQGVQNKMDSTYRKKGQKAVGDVTYKNDSRYKDPNNKVVATVAYMDSSFKKDKLRDLMSTKMVFGKAGEAYITRDEKKGKDVQWFIFNYAEKANYIVMPEDKSAIKMPLINFKKMIEKAAAKEAQRAEDGDSVLVATDEYEMIAGYRARRFKSKGVRGEDMDMWVSKDVRMDLGPNYVMGARLNSYKFPEGKNGQYKDMAGGFVVRTVLYDRKGNISWTRTLQEFAKGKADEAYFDMSKFKVMDVLSGL